MNKMVERFGRRENDLEERKHRMIDKQFGMDTNSMKGNFGGKIRREDMFYVSSFFLVDVVPQT